MSDESDLISVVSGLPRSGTSMMMSMLTAGGLEPLVDDIRSADDDNPKGYFEFEKVKSLAKESDWLSEARGRLVKIVSAHLKHLPSSYRYRIVFMQRRMEEVLASQRQMLIRRGEPTDRVSDEKMAQLFTRHLRDVEHWLAQQANLSCLYVNYNAVLADAAAHLKSINDFFGGRLDISAMARVVDSSLYRQRKA